MTSDRLPEPQALHAQPKAAERASATPVATRPKLGRSDLQPRAAAPQNLSELQSWLVSAICEPHEPVCTGVVSDGPRLTGQQCLEIYRYAYTARLSECLRDDYSVLAATLGDERFGALCQQYIAAHPSRSPSLNAFGRHMPDVCRALSTFYADLARLEWALVEVTHAKTSAALDLSALQALPSEKWGEARLAGSHALRLLTFEYPVNAHYQAYRRDGIVLPLPAAQVCSTAVYRREQMLWRMDLTPAMTHVLSALLEGATIGQALARMSVPDLNAAEQAEAERSVMTWFQAWMSAGFFSELLAP